MKKIIVIFILLLIWSLALCAEEEATKESGITFWGIIGIILFLAFFAILIIIASAIVSSGNFDSGNILVRKGEKINLELNPFPAEETEKVTIGVLIKEIIGNKITLQCKICQKGKTLLTQVIGIEKGKKFKTQIKKILNYPIEISVCCSNKDQMEINVERVPSTENIIFDSYSVNNWN